MRAVVQRVSAARVVIDGREHARIDAGLLVLLGVERDDTEAAARLLARKIVELRVFEDEAGRMNRSVLESGGAILVVSQFTLLGDCRRGRRPSFDRAAPTEEARFRYEEFVDAVRKAGAAASTGVFQAMMDVESVNTGPVTLLLDSRRLF